MYKTVKLIEDLWREKAGENLFLKVDPYQFIEKKILGEKGNLLTTPLYIIPLEWFTYYLALLRGVDPGKSKLVRKIRDGRKLK